MNSNRGSISLLRTKLLVVVVGGWFFYGRGGGVGVINDPIKFTKYTWNKIATHRFSFDYEFPVFSTVWINAEEEKTGFFPLPFRVRKVNGSVAGLNKITETSILELFPSPPPPIPMN